MKNRIISTILLLMGAIGYVFAQTENVAFVATAPSQVAMNQQFKLEYTIKNASPNIQEPDLSDFSVISGPSFNKVESVTIINGNMQRQTSHIITYYLMPTKEGTFTISPINFKHNGETIMCNAVTIKVVEAGQANSQQRVATSQNNRNNSSANASNPANNPFVKTIYSKKSVYEQEEVMATIILYHRGNLQIEDAKLPEYKGCVTKEIQMKNEDRYGEEVVDGVRYFTYKLKQTILYPQKSGTIEIEKGELSTIMEVQSRNIFDFDSFFNGPRRVRKIIPFDGAKLEVKALPEGKPADFNNAVGSFKMESSISQTEAKAHDPITIKVKISGTGNIKYIKSPSFTFPTDFDTYEPKENTKTSGNSGSREIDYLIIPRHAGTFEIPAATFSYFDLNTKRYHTLKTESFTLNIEKSDNNTDNSQVISNFTKENVQIIGKDIRYINTQSTKVEKKAKDIFGTFGFWMWYILPLLLFITLVILYRKQIQENANIALVKNKRANKQAKKCLKQADVFLKSGDKEHFYEEIAKALWGYTSDKLNIPLSELNKESIETELKERQASEETIQEFMEILHTCEFARYAPSDKETAMDELYNQTADVIGKLEEQVR